MKDTPDPKFTKENHLDNPYHEQLLLEVCRASSPIVLRGLGPCQTTGPCDKSWFPDTCELHYYST